MISERWRKATCRCGRVTGWRHEYTGGQMRVVFHDGDTYGDTCPECGRYRTTYTVQCNGKEYWQPEGSTRGAMRTGEGRIT